MVPLDFSGTSVTFIGTAEMPVMLLAADDGNEDEGESEDRAKKGDDKGEDEGAGGWDRLWDAPKLGACCSTLHIVRDMTRCYEGSPIQRV